MKGSIPYRWNSQKVTYPPNMRKVPWRTFRMFITPHTSENPMATQA